MEVEKLQQVWKILMRGVCWACGLSWLCVFCVLPVALVMELSSGKEWAVSLKEKSEHRILLVCEMKLKPDASDGTQPYLLLGVILQLKEDAIAEGRKRIPAGLQL